MDLAESKLTFNNSAEDSETQKKKKIFLLDLKIYCIFWAAQKLYITVTSVTDIWFKMTYI